MRTDGHQGHSLVDLHRVCFARQDIEEDGVAVANEDQGECESHTWRRLCCRWQRGYVARCSRCSRRRRGHQEGAEDEGQGHHKVPGFQQPGV